MSIEHSQVLELLPWYVTGTLSEAESESVRSHIGECLPCRAAYRNELRLHRTFAANGAAPIGEDRGLSDLLASIDRSRADGAEPARGARLSGYALAAAVVVAVGVIALRPWLGGPADQASFSTLFDETSITAPRADVIFTENPSPDDLAQFLQDFGATLTGGPTALGRYTVEFESAADIDSVLESLRADTRLRFAGRSFDDAEPDTDDTP